MRSSHARTAVHAPTLALPRTPPTCSGDMVPPSCEAHLDDSARCKAGDVDAYARVGDVAWQQHGHITEAVVMWTKACTHGGEGSRDALAALRCFHYGASVTAASLPRSVTQATPMPVCTSARMIRAHPTRQRSRWRARTSRPFAHARPAKNRSSAPCRGTSPPPARACLRL